MSFQCKPSVADRLRELANADLQKLAAEGPTAEEFDMTLKNFQKNVPERRIRNSYWQEALQVWYQFGLDTDKDYEKAVNSLTPAAIQAMARTLVSSGNFAEMVMRPGVTAEEE